MKGNFDEVLGHYHEAYKLAEKTSVSGGGPSEHVCITIKTLIAQIFPKQERYADHAEREADHVYFEPLQVRVCSKISPGIVDVEYPGNVIGYFMINYSYTRYHSN